MFRLVQVSSCLAPAVRVGGKLMKIGDTVFYMPDNMCCQGYVTARVEQLFENGAIIHIFSSGEKRTVLLAALSSNHAPFAARVAKALNRKMQNLVNIAWQYNKMASKASTPIDITNLTINELTSLLSEASKLKNNKKEELSYISQKYIAQFSELGIDEFQIAKIRRILAIKRESITPEKMYSLINKHWEK
jgi:hypothetical protein